MSAAESSAGALKASKWPAFRPYVTAATVVALVTSIVLSILAFGDPEMMKWGWAGVGIAAITLPLASGMIYAMIHKRGQMTEKTSHSSHVDEEAPSDVHASEPEGPSSTKEVIWNWGEKDVWTWLLNHPGFYPPFYEQTKTFRGSNTALLAVNLKEKEAIERQLGRLNYSCELETFIPIKGAYKKREKELICYFLANIPNLPQINTTPINASLGKNLADRILRKISESPKEEDDDDFVVHLLEVQMGEKFTKRMGESETPIYTDFFKSAINKYYSKSDLPRWLCL